MVMSPRAVWMIAFVPSPAGAGATSGRGVTSGGSKGPAGRAELSDGTDPGALEAHAARSSVAHPMAKRVRGHRLNVPRPRSASFAGHLRVLRPFPPETHQAGARRPVLSSRRQTRTVPPESTLRILVARFTG